VSQLLLSWLFATSLALVVVAGGVRAGRRRSALNEALHELRRPLQALSLVAPEVAAGRSERELDLSLRMAASALERLEREVNGGPGVAAGERFAVEPLAREAVARWRARAAHAGVALELRWSGPEVVLHGNRTELAGALDNLIVNAIEHGGPRISVDGSAVGDELRLVVADRGRSCAADRRRPWAERLARATGRARRGHGLRLVRRVAAGHGGRFELRRAASGAEAALELPLDRGGTG